MNALTRTPSREHAAAQHAAHYEALRQHATARLPPIARHGLAVLLRQGVAMWMAAWSKMPAAAGRSVKVHTPRPSPVPDDVSTEVVRVLAAMTLAHIEQVHT